MNVNPDLEALKLEALFRAATERRRLQRAYRYVLDEPGATAMQEGIALAAARCAMQPVLDRRRLRDARIALCCGLLLLAAAAGLTGAQLLHPSDAAETTDVVASQADSERP